MLRMIIFSVTIFLVSTSSAKALNDKASNGYHLTKIKRIESASLGAQRLYFDLECNERMVDVLTEKSDSDRLKVAILTQFHSSNCTKPPHETFTRFRLGQTNVDLVDSFDEVWSCSGLCYTPTSSGASPYQPVHEYGTSEKQARAKIPCYPGYQINIVCEEIEVSQ